MRRAMIDIETLDTANSAVIIQIALVVFDGARLDPKEEFDRRISIDSQLDRSISTSTLSFWMKQEVQLQDIIGITDLDTSLRELCRFTRNQGIKEFWSKGSFDFNILDNAMAERNITPPWKFWQIRDFRTIQKLVSVEIPENEMLHDALADAHHQMDELTLILNKLNKLR